MPFPVVVKSSLGPDTLVFRRLTGHEALGRPFEYEVDLASADEVVPRDLLGTHVSIEVETDGDPRIFDGVVTRFASLGGASRNLHYRLTLRPWSWIFLRSQDARIFQQLSTPDIFAKIAHDARESEFSASLTGTYSPHEYKVQYRESNFDFVSRLFEDAGIYYFFKHAAGKHTLVTADAPSAHTYAHGCNPLPFRPGDDPDAADASCVVQLEFAQRPAPGTVALTDYDFVRPAADLTSKAKKSGTLAFKDFEVYDYPGVYVQTSDGDRIARVRIEELHATADVLQGETNARSLGTGTLFKLSEHPIDAHNVDYLVASASYEIVMAAPESSGRSGPAFTYRCRFEAVRNAVPFRPERTTRVPTMAGPQTALVVGDPSEEIWTDQYGRVKVQFHWDRLGKNDDKSSCWLRVAQTWAGAGWGSVHVPRVGDEVIVEFLEGDPDRPLVTGRLYNGTNATPWKLPDNRTQSGIRTRSTPKGNADNFNEYRFEDKKGSEMVFIQAEKDLQRLVKNDETDLVKHDRKRTVENDEAVEVKNNRTHTIGKSETTKIGENRTETVEKDETITIKGKRTEEVTGDEKITVKANRTEEVDGDEKITVKGGRTEEVTGDEKVTIKGARTGEVKGDDTEKVDGNYTLTIGGDGKVKTTGASKLNVGGDATISVTGKRKSSITGDEQVDSMGAVKITAVNQITLSAGAASITLKATGEVEIKGVMVKVEGSAMTTVKAGAMLQLQGAIVKT